MVNSLRKCSTQMHPSCHMNYSIPTVCTGLGKQQDFKAGLKDEWMSTWIKGVGKNEVQKKIQWVANTNTALSHGNEGQQRKRKLLSQCPKLFIFLLAYD